MPELPSPAGSSPFAATVVMATRNRKDELRRAIETSLAQTVPVQVIVNDDGSTDGTGEMVQRDFPMVVYGRSEKPAGSIVNRNKAVRAASSNIIISIDDEASFPSPRTVEQTIREFDDPRVGCVAVPYIDVYKTQDVHKRAPEGSGVWITTYFRGCAAAWRRDYFLSIGGYTEALYHMGEEPELAMRMLNAGWVCRLGGADPVHHFESPNRDPRRILRQQARAQVLMGWINAPLFMLPVHLAGVGIKGVLYGLRARALRQMAGGVWRGYLDCLPNWGLRRPMSAGAYFLYRRLSRSGPRRMDEVAGELPALMKP
ncbi:MAG: glycosyltransferase family 2 protein [Phycisphaerales bacterium]